ncbi:thiolase family protein [Antricoccus suffuscus]|nr:thiolase family protein [Antricoccus suffuscus]
MTSTSTGTPRASIAGLGITDMGKVYGRTATDFADDAVRRAVDDAGLELSDIDGLLVSKGVGDTGLNLKLRDRLGLRELAIASEINSFGATASVMMGYASELIQSGQATTIACLFADAPLKQGLSAGEAYGHRGRVTPVDFAGVRIASGMTSTTMYYSLAAQRHMNVFGTTSEQFGHVAVSQRAWAEKNPLATMRKPMTLQDHQDSRMVADPLHLLDCCLVSNGGVAVIVTSAERARDLKQRPVDVLGYGQTHLSHPFRSDSKFGIETGAAQAGPKALAMAGLSVNDVDLLELYDCYTYTVLITLEDYGFCAKGEGGAFVADGKLGPGGSLPTNTGGGQLSSYYMWGFTPLSEAIIQARGDGGDRQVDKRDVIMVSGNGGILEHHGTTILTPGENAR